MYPQYLFHALSSFTAEADERAERRRNPRHAGDVAGRRPIHVARPSRGREPAAPCAVPQPHPQVCVTG